jgi:hypothetical protein
MKIAKSVKYTYKLTEENLEKDIDSFIREARNGEYSWDSKYNGEGIKIIKQYLKILQEKFKKEEYGECSVCYDKLILFLIDSSIGEDGASFGYEDLLAKISKNFDEHIKGYFICIIKNCNAEELVDNVKRYALSIGRGGYGFDSDTSTLIDLLDNNTLEKLEEIMLIKIENVQKREEKMDLVYFLMKLIEEQKNRNKYSQITEKLKGILTQKEFEGLIEDFTGED